MTEARALKSKEYNTDILSHPDNNVVNYNQKVRYNNTNKSSCFHNERDHDAERAVKDKRESHFREVPTHDKATRASYQDSNIFSTKDGSRGTTQAGAL